MGMDKRGDVGASGCDLKSECQGLSPSSVTSGKLIEPLYFSFPNLHHMGYKSRLERVGS